MVSIQVPPVAWKQLNFLAEVANLAPRLPLGSDSS